MLKANITGFDFISQDRTMLQCRCEGCEREFWIDPADYVDIAASESVVSEIRCKDCTDKLLES